MITFFLVNLNQGGQTDTTKIIIIATIIVPFLIISLGVGWICNKHYNKRKGQRQVINFVNTDPCLQLQESTLLVYPGGCTVLERFVATMAALLRCMGIEVFAECTHTLEAAPDIAGFYAHYSEYVSRVVLICTEPLTTENPYHNPFVFVYKNMIEEQCMFRVDRERFLAIYLHENEIDNVPLLLKKRAHLIPNGFESFLLAIGSMKKWPGYKNDVAQILEGCDKAKEELLACVNNLANPEHSKCFQSACRHGQVADDGHSRVISMSELTEQFSCYTRDQSMTYVNHSFDTEEAPT